MKNFPLDEKNLREVIKKYPTPFHLYEEKKIRDNFRRLRETFSWAAEFREYFAVKALPNPHIVKILAEDGAGTDCSSLAELIISERANVTGEKIMLTSNDTPAEEFQKAISLGAIINLDDITHIDFLEENAGLPKILSFRYNPADIMNSGNDIIGKPAEAKYGLTRQQIFDAYKISQGKGVKRFGLHTMIASNERETETFLYTAQIMFELAVEIKNQLGINLEFVNLGGGFGIPYRPEENRLIIKRLAREFVNFTKKFLYRTGLKKFVLQLKAGVQLPETRVGLFQQLSTKKILTKIISVLILAWQI